MNRINRETLRYGALFACAALAQAANAAAVDVEDIVTDIGAQLTPIGLIGGAVLLIFVGLKGYKWVRKALS